MVELIVIGIATAFNFIILKWKFEHERYGDAVLDIGVFFALNWMFGGTMSGMAVAMLASMIVSLYLLGNPPKFLHEEDQ